MPVWVMPPLPFRLKESPGRREKVKVPRDRSRLIELLPGAVLILLGALFLITYYGFLGGEWWQYFVVGLGLLLVIEAWIQYRGSTRRRFRILSIISGLIMVIGGFLFLFNPNWWWPIVIIGAGVILMLLVLLMRTPITGQPESSESEPEDHTEALATQQSAVTNGSIEETGLVE